MTSEEFHTLREHDKIRFIGDPGRTCYNEEHSQGGKIKKPLIKGKTYTVLSMSKTNGLCLFGVSTLPGARFYGQKKSFPFRIPILPIPEDKNPQYNDWELVQIRHHGVELRRKAKLGVRGVNKTLYNLERHVAMNIDYYKGVLERYLKDVPIERKVLLLSSFKEKHKKILELLFEYKDFSTFVDQWDKGAHPEEGDKSNPQSGNI